MWADEDDSPVFNASPCLPSVDESLGRVQINGLNLQFAPACHQADRSIVMAAVTENGRALQFASDELKSELDVVLNAVAQVGSSFEFASVDLKSSHEVLLQALQYSWYPYKFAPKDLQLKDDIILAAFKSDMPPHHFPTERGGDRELVLQVVRLDGNVLRHVSADLKLDYEVVLAAVENDGAVLTVADLAENQEMMSDKKLVLSAVSLHGRSLSSASAALRGDREIVFTAVKQNGWALEYASEELKGDRDIVLSAVVYREAPLEYAPTELRATLLREADAEDLSLQEYAQSQTKCKVIQLAINGPREGADTLDVQALSLSGSELARVELTRDEDSVRILRMKFAMILEMHEFALRMVSPSGEMLQDRPIDKSLRKML